MPWMNNNVGPEPVSSTYSRVSRTAIMFRPMLPPLGPSSVLAITPPHIALDRPIVQPEIRRRIG
jgi:hypothetical protein